MWLFLVLFASLNADVHLEEGKPVVWLYAETAPSCPEIVQEKFGEDFTIITLDKSSVNEWLPDLPPQWGQLPKLSDREEYIRLKLLWAYGGLWLDCDWILSHSFDEAAALLRDYELIVKDKTLIGAQAGAPILAHLLEGWDSRLIYGRPRTRVPLSKWLQQTSYFESPSPIWKTL